MKIAKRLVVSLGCLLSCSSAHAHAHLTAAVPADGMVVTTSPTTLSLAFTEGLSLKLSGATLKGLDGKPVATGAISLSAPNKKTMNIAIPGELGTGTYTVDWHAFSDDGHTSRGTYQFTVGR